MANTTKTEVSLNKEGTLILKSTTHDKTDPTLGSRYHYSTLDPTYIDLMNNRLGETFPNIPIPGQSVTATAGQIRNDMLREITRRTNRNYETMVRGFPEAPPLTTNGEGTEVPW